MFIALHPTLMLCIAEVLNSVFFWEMERLEFIGFWLFIYAYALTWKCGNLGFTLFSLMCFFFRLFGRTYISIQLNKNLPHWMMAAHVTKLRDRLIILLTSVANKTIIWVNLAVITWRLKCLDFFTIGRSYLLCCFFHVVTVSLTSYNDSWFVQLRKCC